MKLCSFALSVRAISLTPAQKTNHCRDSAVAFPLWANHLPSFKRLDSPARQSSHFVQTACSLSRLVQVPSLSVFTVLGCTSVQQSLGQRYSSCGKSRGGSTDMPFCRMSLPNVKNSRPRQDALHIPASFSPLSTAIFAPAGMVT